MTYLQRWGESVAAPRNLCLPLLAFFHDKPRVRKRHQGLRDFWSFLGARRQCSTLGVPGPVHSSSSLGTGPRCMAGTLFPTLSVY